MNWLKSFGTALGILVISLILFSGCTSSTGSTSSGSSLLPRVQVNSAASTLQASQASDTDPIVYTWSSTFITVTVRDANGNLVPAGVPVDVTCGAGYLGDNPDASNPISFITASTNSNGQVLVRYTAGFTAGTASISAASQGNYGSTTIKITSS
jgi:hypothetical protein